MTRRAIIEAIQRPFTGQIATLRQRCEEPMPTDASNALERKLDDTDSPATSARASPS